MASTGYFGKLNPTLVFVVPLAMFWVETCSVRVDKGQTRVQETNLRDTDYSELKRRKKRGMSITALSQVVQFQFSLRGRILQNVA